ncbi:MAG: OmpA family protein [Myxococcota bacterium]
MTTEPPSWGTIPPIALIPLRTYARRAMAADNWTSVRPLLRPIAGWRMDYSRFEFDSSFIQPWAREEIANLATLHEQHPQSPLSVFGHADPTGNDEYNKQLSGRRALAVYGMLVRDVEIWERLYGSPMAGDRWGERAIQQILATLTDDDGMPFYAGSVDDYWGTASREALEKYQASNIDPNGAPLAMDGMLGPLSRKSMYHLYMESLCTRADGFVLSLTDEQFLARGRDPDHRGDVQGCSEFNPRMVFSTEEHAKYQSFALAQERNEQNAENRRVVVFLYPAGVEVKPSWWPCPKAESGSPSCRKRFWSDASTRRNPQERRRHFDGDMDTFGCRFYHHIGLNTPAETPVTLGLTFDVYLHREAGHGAPDGSYRLVSDDGEVDEQVPGGAAVLIAVQGEGEIRCLSFTGLARGKRYTLSFQPAGDGEFEPVVLVAQFELEDFDRSEGDDGEPEEVSYVAGQDDAYLDYETPEEGVFPPPSSPPDPEEWEVEDHEVDWDGTKVVFTRVTEPAPSDDNERHDG